MLYFMIFLQHYSQITIVPSSHKLWRLLRTSSFYELFIKHMIRNLQNVAPSKAPKYKSGVLNRHLELRHFYVLGTCSAEHVVFYPTKICMKIFFHEPCRCFFHPFLSIRFFYKTLEIFF